MTISAKYSIDEKCDRSLKSLTIDPLRLVHCIDVIRRFVKHRSDFHYGYLSHALAAELENFIQEVNLQIINFETRQKGKELHQTDSLSIFKSRALTSKIHGTIKFRRIWK